MLFIAWVTAETIRQASKTYWGYVVIIVGYFILMTLIENRKKAIANKNAEQKILIEERMPCKHGVVGANLKPDNCNSCIEEKNTEQKKREQQLILQAEEHKQREIAWRKKLRDKAYLQQVDPRDFENIVLFLYQNLGYSTKATPTTGDEGIDGYLRRDGELILLQCKRVMSSVGQPVVRDLYGNVQHHLPEEKKLGNSVSGLLVTTGKVSQQAKTWAAGKPIKFIELDDLVLLIKNHIGIDNIIPENFQGSALHVPKEICPKCGNKLRKIIGKFGQFYGCSSYPLCRYTSKRSR
jgi:restriction system protein